ncbi:DegV family protein [Erysipelothrix rhusiopathiae]|uniref:DegV family protein n=1 Tax=Erysipelothrix rhusiopathiae TaxID=1648 RepID=UPI002B24DB92|nr:DegV family protein [Erysipelothrix rhusiopathiae]WRB92454.1 DegV family protein [Erysipelothrix rhusiopathiae]
MKKIAIICDSSVSFTQAEIETFGVYIAPLTIIHNNTVYIDQVTITENQVNDLLRNHEVVKTSQPNLGTIYELFEKVMREGYDHIFALSIGTALSGTYSSMEMVRQDLKIENMSVINTHSITGPVQQAVAAIRKMNEEDYSVEQIEVYLDHFFSNQISYIYPQSLDQVIASGRVSKTAAKVASLLKIKPVLYLENKGESIEKLGVARSERRIFSLLVNDLVHHDVKPDTHDIYLLHSEGLDTLKRFQDFLTESLGPFTIKIVNLPAAVATHAGIGTLALQWCYKI